MIWLYQCHSLGQASMAQVQDCCVRCLESDPFEFPSSSSNSSSSLSSFSESIAKCFHDTHLEYMPNTHNTTACAWAWIFPRFIYIWASSSQGMIRLCDYFVAHLELFKFKSYCCSIKCCQQSLFVYLFYRSWFYCPYFSQHHTYSLIVAVVSNRHTYPSTTHFWPSPTQTCTYVATLIILATFVFGHM